MPANGDYQFVNWSLARGNQWIILPAEIDPDEKLIEISQSDFTQLAANANACRVIGRIYDAKDVEKEREKWWKTFYDRLYPNYSPEAKEILEKTKHLWETVYSKKLFRRPHVCEISGKSFRSPYPLWHCHIVTEETLTWFRDYVDDFSSYEFGDLAARAKSIAICGNVLSNPAEFNLRRVTSKGFKRSADSFDYRVFIEIREEENEHLVIDDVWTYLNDAHKDFCLIQGNKPSLEMRLRPTVYEYTKETDCLCNDFIPQNKDFPIGYEWETVICSNDEDDTFRQNLGAVLSVANKDKWYWLPKFDGSLPEHGVEFVSAALPFREHRKILRNIDFMETFPTDKLRYSDAGSLHVHIDSRAFSPLSLIKFYSLWNNPRNAEYIRKWAGRHPEYDSGASNYAPISFPFRADRKTVETIRDRFLYDRYAAVNLTCLGHAERDRLRIPDSVRRLKKFNTVELRIFASPRNLDQLFGRLSLAHASVIFARQAKSLTPYFGNFLDWITNDKAAVPYGALRKAILHEKTTSSE